MLRSGSGVEQLRVDYYAGASALLVVILFAKFSTHTAHRNAAAGSGRGVPGLWHWVHLICVGFAWLGIAASLAMLGWFEADVGAERVVRAAVAIMAGVASILLAIDVAREPPQDATGSGRQG
jgi:hypothetical protein